jgi:hypothetical protein
MATRSPGVLLFTTKDNQFCDEARAQLDLAGVKVKEIDAKEKGLMAALPRDLGVTGLPVLVSEKGIFAGPRGITEFLRSLFAEKSSST